MPRVGQIGGDKNQVVALVGKQVKTNVKHHYKTPQINVESNSNKSQSLHSDEKSEDSLYQMYGTLNVMKNSNLNPETNSVSQAVRQKLKEKIISSAYSCRERNIANRNKQIDMTGA